MAALPLQLGLKDGDRLAVVGCGGKTTLVGSLSEAWAAKPVLVMPTTQIRPMQGEGMALCTTLEDCLTHLPATGIQCLGVLNPATGKLHAPPPEHWPQLTKGYHLVLMEADGSALRPCKGWAPHEPVVPDFTTKTIGLLPITAVGLPVNEENVWRPQLFSALTGLRAEAPVTLEGLAAMVAAPGGMFKNAKGEAILFINQVENEAQLATAIQLADAIRSRYPGIVNHFVAGSALAGVGQPV